MSAPFRVIPQPTRIEALANLLVGVDEHAPPFPSPSAKSVREAFADVVLPCLERAPCFVSFSGGRDSSAVLALAVDLARRHGLADPIPASMRFPDAPASEETEWQSIVIEHLHLREHVIVELHDELDLLGDIATALLRRHGVRWPANTHMHVPLLERARGGSLLTGVGGDELFDSRASRFILVRHRLERARPRDLASLGLSLSPRRVRQAVWRRRTPPGYTWLTPAAHDEVADALAEDASRWPPRWDRSLAWWYRSRAFASVQGILPSLASEWDVQLLNPFVEDGMLASLTAAAGATGFVSREVAMQQLVGDLLPTSILARPYKASFNGAVWGPRSREFAATWNGDGLDTADVDVDALRREWATSNPDFRTALLLHVAWLASSAAR